MDLKDAVDQFLDAVQPFRSMWASIERKSLLIKKNDEWRVIHSRAVLQDVPPSSNRTNLVYQSYSVIAIVESLDIGSLDALISTLDVEHIDMDAYLAMVPRPSLAYVPGASFVRSSPHSYQSHVEPFGDFIVSTSFGMVMEAIDHDRVSLELRNRAFAGGLREMTEARLGFAVDPFSSNVWIGLIAPIYLAAGAESLGGEVYATPLVGQGVDGTEIRFRLESFGATEREVLDVITGDLGSAIASPEEGHIRLRMPVTLPDEAKSARLAFFYRNVADPIETAVVSIGFQEGTPVIRALNALGRPRKGGFTKPSDRISGIRWGWMVLLSIRIVSSLRC